MSFVLFLIPLMVLLLVRFLSLQLQSSCLSWMSIRQLADGLSARHLKEIAKVIAPPLTTLHNEFLKEGKVPSVSNRIFLQSIKEAALMTLVTIGLSLWLLRCLKKLFPPSSILTWR